MGQFRITVTAQGGHGCEREVKDGEVSFGCHRQGCPDCEAMRSIEDFLKHSGATFVTASLTHFPDTSGEVVDQFVLHPGGTLSRIRHGRFA